MTPGERSALARAIELARADRARVASLERQRALRELTEKLLPEIAPESVVDPLEHARAVAKTILHHRGKGPRR